MSILYDRGPLLTFEVIWTSGNVERIQAHTADFRNGRVNFWGEVGGRWQLILAASEADIRTIRNVTREEALQS